MLPRGDGVGQQCAFGRQQRAGGFDKTSTHARSIAYALGAALRRVCYFFGLLVSYRPLARDFAEG